MPQFQAHELNRENQNRLLQALAEQLKMPLMQIARQAELAKLTGQPQDAMQVIELTADNALQLLDNYLLSIELARRQALHIEMEPVSVSAVLNDSAHELYKLAAQYGCELELDLAGRYEPIIANRTGLQAALTSLGHVFIEAGAQRSEHRYRPVIKLAAHRGKQGIVAGAFADVEGLSNDMFRRSRQLYGRTRQPLTGLTAASGAGVFVAESLMSSMSAHLRIARHHKLSGLAATFASSQQMSLV
jgi:hypothetical protein